MIPSDESLFHLPGESGQLLFALKRHHRNTARRPTSSLSALRPPPRSRHRSLPPCRSVSWRDLLLPLPRKAGPEPEAPLSRPRLNCRHAPVATNTAPYRARRSSSSSSRPISVFSWNFTPIRTSTSTCLRTMSTGSRYPGMAYRSRPPASAGDPNTVTGCPTILR